MRDREYAGSGSKADPKKQSKKVSNKEEKEDPRRKEDDRQRKSRDGGRRYESSRYEGKERRSMPEESKEKAVVVKERIYKGLNNIGNTCFFNSVLQNVSNLTFLYSQYSQTDPDYYEYSSVSRAFYFFLRQMHIQSTKSISPRELLSAISHQNPRFRGYHQQDANELFSCMIDMLDEENKKMLGIDKQKSMIDRETHTIIESSFGGVQQSIVVCQNCYHVSKVENPVFGISVMMPTNRKEISSNYRGMMSRAKEVMKNIGSRCNPFKSKKPPKEEKKEKKTSHSVSEYEKKQIHQKVVRFVKEINNEYKKLKGDHPNDTVRKELKRKLDYIRDYAEIDEEKRKNERILEIVCWKEGYNLSMDEESVEEKKEEKKESVEEKKEKEAKEEEKSVEEAKKEEKEIVSMEEAKKENETVKKESIDETKEEEEKKNVIVVNVDVKKEEKSVIVDVKEKENVIVVNVDVKKEEKNIEENKEENKEEAPKEENKEENIEENKENIEENKEEKKEEAPKEENKEEAPKEENKEEKSVSAEEKEETVEEEQKEEEIEKETLEQQQAKLSRDKEQLARIYAQYHYHEIDSKQVNEESLFEALKVYYSTESITTDQGCEYKCPCCSKQRESRSIYKRVTNKQLPNILVIHIKRFTHSNYSGYMKDNTHVDFPEELNMNDFCMTNMSSKQTHYRLSGVVNHSGGMGGGHYTCHIRDQNDSSLSKWYYISDSYVAPCNIRDVLNSQAYMLFYERLAEEDD